MTQPPETFQQVTWPGRLHRGWRFTPKAPPSPPSSVMMVFLWHQQSSWTFLTINNKKKAQHNCVFMEIDLVVISKS